MIKKATIKDVALKAGVSIASVSHFLNNKKGRYSEETGDKILKAINELGYELDINARILAKGRSNLIGLVLPITHKSSTSTILLRDNPFYGELIDGISHITSLKNYDLLISGFDKIENCLGWIKKRNLDGVIFVGIYPKSIDSILNEAYFPVVMIDMEEKKSSHFFNIKTDDESASFQAVSYLIQCGHKNIAFATGFLTGSHVNKARYKGYIRALEDNNIKNNKGFCFEDTTSFEGGYRMGEKIINSNLHITAVSAASDIVAFGLMRGFMDLKKKVPEDISVIGFDDIKMCSYMSPYLTTVRQNIEKKGHIAAETIIQEIEKRKNIEKTIIIPSEIIVRETVKKI